MRISKEKLHSNMKTLLENGQIQTELSIFDSYVIIASFLNEAQYYVYSKYIIKEVKESKNDPNYTCALTIEHDDEYVYINNDCKSGLCAMIKEYNEDVDITVSRVETWPEVTESFYLTFKEYIEEKIPFVIFTLEYRNKALKLGAYDEYVLFSQGEFLGLYENLT